MTKKHYTLIMNYQFTSFETEYEKINVKELESDDLNELFNILTTYVNGFMSKKKKLSSWMYFSAEIRNNKLLTYDLEYKTYSISMERRD